VYNSGTTTHWLFGCWPWLLDVVAAAVAANYVNQRIWQQDTASDSGNKNSYRRPHNDAAANCRLASLLAKAKTARGRQLANSRGRSTAQEPQDTGYRAKRMPGGYAIGKQKKPLGYGFGHGYGYGESGKRGVTVSDCK